MRRATKATALALLLALSPLPLAAACFDYCHSSAMLVMDQHGERAATAFFHGCMDSCGRDFRTRA